MQTPVRVGIVGLGMAGQGHLRAFASDPRAEVVCAFDPDESARSSIAAEMPALRRPADLRGVLCDDTIDLVVIATPHKYHCELVTKCLRADKHVLCEKPLAVSTAECDHMIAVARQAGRQLFVVQTQRGAGPFRRLKSILDEHDFGACVGARAAYLGCEVQRMGDPLSWKCTKDTAGGGVLLDGGCHVIDLCNWYLGQPVRVIGQCRVPADWPDHKAETGANVLITYKDGATVQVFCTFESRLPGSFTEATLRVAVELYFENGMAQAEYAYFGKHGLHRSVSYVCGDDEKHQFEPTASDDVPFAQHVVACLLDGDEPVVTAEEARMTVAVAEAAYVSARTQAAVDLPPLSEYASDACYAAVPRPQDRNGIDVPGTGARHAATHLRGKR